MKRRVCLAALILLLTLAFAGCGGEEAPEEEPEVAEAPVEEEAPPEEEAPSEDAEAPAEEPAAETPEEEDAEMRMKIGDTYVTVEWEKNESVAALRALTAEGPLAIEMSMYGGFEQVGAIGQRLPSSDVQTKTKAGDIVLYQSDQLVVFYGANSWAYTRLGHVTDQDAAGMAALLGNGDVTITIEGGER